MSTHDISCTGFALVFAAEDEKKTLWGRLICALLLFTGLGWCLWNTLGLSGIGASPLLLLAIGCVCCALSCRLPGKWDFAYIGVIVALAVLIGFANRYIAEGGGIAMNHLYAAMEQYIGRAFPRFFVSEDVNQTLCAMFFLLVPTGLLAVLCGRVAGVAKGWRFALLPFVFALWLAALVFQIELPLIGVLALIIAAISLPPSRVKALRHAESNQRLTAWILILAAALSLLAAAPALVVLDADGSAATALRLTATRKIHSMRYDGENQTLPEGDFGKLPAFLLGEEPALTVSTEKLGKYYLRGFVGEIYTGDGWTTLTPRQRAEYAELFVWLHERGFYAQSQYALLKNALGVENRTTEFQITNDGVSTAYLYAPYELMDSRTDEMRIGDENLRATGLRGETTYTVTVSDGSIADDDRLYAGLVAAINRAEPQATRYLTSESAYREFVYTSYLDIPNNAHAAIERFLSEVTFPDGKISFDDAKLVVNTYLGTLGYTESPELAPSGGDVLTHFLEDSRSGNSAQLATAAVLMFRYMGVPARYVEGYLITPAAEDSETGVSVLLSEDAYAWAEIYRDGVGFLPFEPEYPAIPPLAPLDMAPPLDAPEEPPIIPPLLNPKTYITALIGLIILLLLIFVVLVIRRSIKMRRLHTLFDTNDNTIAVSRRTTYAIQLLSHMGITWNNESLFALHTELESRFGHEFGAEYATVISTQQAALFSGQPISDENRARVIDFQHSLSEELKKQSNTRQRFRLRWIDCVL